MITWRILAAFGFILSFSGWVCGEQAPELRKLSDRRSIYQLVVLRIGAYYLAGIFLHFVTFGTDPLQIITNTFDRVSQRKSCQKYFSCSLGESHLVSPTDSLIHRIIGKVRFFDEVVGTPFEKQN